jgi:beta-carotene 15,15'-dioxygenase
MKNKILDTAFIIGGCSGIFLKTNLQAMDRVKNATHKILETPTLISIAAGSFLLFWQQLTGVLPPSVQIVFFALFIFLTGIPHGAIDHLVEKETLKRQQKRFNLPLFFAKYLLTMLFYALVWVIFPSLSLLFFLLMSAWHFGETDIEKAPPTLLWNIARFTFGCLILSWILLFHAVEVTPILERISQNNEAVMDVWQFLVPIKSIILVGLAAFSSVFCYFGNKNSSLDFDKIRFLRLFFIVVLTYFLPLLPAFALYFGGWHALCSIVNIHEYLEMKKGSDKKNNYLILKTWSKTLAFMLLAVSFLVLAIWYWLHFYQTWDALPLLFIFLSLITLPHLNVMHRMSRNQ